MKISIVNEILKGNNIGWNFAVNPLDINRTGKERGYHDYHNPQVREAINSLRIKEKWYDYVSWSVPVIGPIGLESIIVVLDKIFIYNCLL